MRIHTGGYTLESQDAEDERNQRILVSHSGFHRITTQAKRIHRSYSNRRLFMEV
jgi:hypothetical protein